MKIIKSAMAAVMLLVAIATTALAQEYPKPTGYVNDFARLLTHDQGKSLNDELAAFEQKTTIEIAVVTVSSLNGKSIEDYTSELATSWGVGKSGKNNGIVFLIAPNEREMRIETASGIRATLTDRHTDEVRDRVVLPRFKEGRMPEGIIDGTRAIMRSFEGGQIQVSQPEVPRQMTEEEKRRSLVILVTFFAVIALCFVLFLVVIPKIITRRSVLKDTQTFPERFVEIEKTSQNSDVNEETRKKIVGLKDELAAIDRKIRSGKLSWSDMRDRLDDLDSGLDDLASEIEQEISFAEEARRDGPELMEKIPDMIETASKELAKGKQSKEAKRHLSEARRQYAHAQEQQSGMTITDWVILYAILQNVQSNTASAVSKHGYANGERSSSSRRSSSSSSSYGYGSRSGFGGGGGFGSRGGGGGSSGKW